MELAGKEECSLGYSKLTYEEYIENPEVYLARGILAPKWANELYGKGYKGVCAIDFYDDIFGGDLEEHRMPEDYNVSAQKTPAVRKNVRGMNAPITNNATIIPIGFSSGIVGFSWPDVLQNAVIRCIALLFQEKHFR